ncbi:hypothetical protein JCM18901_1090 [Psychrobacter sp. JCM 18901]|nr:hypothetical protein JCM18901_1090 [Psychrobacter sp. JCM 18901]
MRIDPNVRPQMFHGATISGEELKQLRRVKNIVRKGRVTRLDTDKIYFGEDSISTTPNTMHIDCSARAVPVTETYDVFKGDTVVVQTVRTYQLYLVPHLSPTSRPVMMMKPSKMNYAKWCQSQIMIQTFWLALLNRCRIRCVGQKSLRYVNG